ncbi:hypothetical protein EV181_006286, partial [Coemansia sp. RSA 532]
VVAAASGVVGVVTFADADVDGVDVVAAATGALVWGVVAGVGAGVVTLADVGVVAAAGVVGVTLATGVVGVVAVPGTTAVSETAGVSEFTGGAE